jgi:hypothetical protein
MRRLLNALWFVAVLGCAGQEPTPKHLRADTPAVAPTVSAVPATKPADVLASAPAKTWVLHLPGVSGESHIDRDLRTGLRNAGFVGDIHIYDWTCKDPGIPALHNRQRNHEQAAIIAQHLTQQFRAAPDVPIYLTCHSGGAGPAVWSLEKLPQDVSVKSLVMISPALSPGYDLSAALSHVSGKAYCFYSPDDDMVLGTGTKLFGTIDGVRTDAAGRVGFTKPQGADDRQYAKLIAKPYEPAWARFGNIGGHVGSMTVPFAHAVIGPIMLEKALAEEELRVIEKAVRPAMDILWPK